MERSKETEFDELTFDSIYPDGIHHHYWTKARNHIILDQLLDNQYASAPVIEIGCGRGVVLSFLQKRGIDIHGVELAACNPYADAKQYMDTDKNALDMEIDFRNKFRTMLFLDVIEHIENPVAFIKDLLGAYPNVAQVLFTVPARQEVWSNYDEKHGHFKRYDLAMADKVMTDIGFKSQDNRHFFHLLYPPARLLALNKKDRNTKIEAPKGIVSKIVHGSLAAYFRIENLILPKTWKGTSILCRGVRTDN